MNKPDNNTILRALTTGENWNGSTRGEPLTISFSFISSLPDYYQSVSPEDGDVNDFLGWVDETNPASFSTFTQNQQLATYQAMLAWASVANITFTNAGTDNTNAVITFGNADFTNDPDHYGITTGRGSSLSEGQNHYYGDIWLNTLGPKGAANLNQTSLGEDGYETILHELGHALELEHPFGGFNNLSAEVEDQLHTTMSYTNANITYDGVQWYPSAPMLYDILAIQTLYGPNMQNHAFNDNYTFSTDANSPSIDALWDAGGNDTFDASNQTASVFINLNPGEFSSIGTGDRDKAYIAIAYNVGVDDNYIENAFGGSANDELIGNDGDNQLTGGEGNDAIDGGVGDDVIFGDAGNDTLMGGDGMDMLAGGTDDDILYGNDNNDTIDGGYGNDDIYGGSGTDTLTGDTGNDTLDGEAGDDVIHGDAGNDNLTGGTGKDTLEGGTNDDTLYGGEDSDTIDGGSGNDVIYGDSGTDTLLGGTGNDILHGDDGAGGDILEGGSGNDTYYADNGDTIRDSDGQGSIYLNGKQLTFATRKAGETLYKDASGNTYIQAGNTLLINDPLIIKNFSSGDLGITLDEYNPNDPNNPTIPTDPLKKAFQTAEQADPIISPIVLDLDSNGIATQGVAYGAFFDYDGNGFAERTGWATPSDGILVRDLNGNGSIDNGTELFGDRTPLKNGQTAANGFVAMADLDNNNDGKLDSQDAVWTELKIWQDRNSDGISNTGELKTLNDLGIQSIATGYTSNTTIDANGNEHRQQGNYTKTDGSSAVAEDIWFKADLASVRNTNLLPLSEAIHNLPEIQGRGNVASLRQVIAQQAVNGVGTLKNLIDQFAAESAPDARKVLTMQIIYAWTGVTDKDPLSRGYYIGDGRKLYAMEALLGESFIGTWGANPLAGASNQLKMAFNEFANGITTQLMQQTRLKDLYNAIAYTWDATTQILHGDLSGTLPIIVAKLDADRVQCKNALAEFTTHLMSTNDIKEFDTRAFQEALEGYGQDVANIAATVWHGMVATQLNDQLTGNSADEIISGWGGNDLIYGGGGNDSLLGEGGSDALYGQDGNDTLDGGVGNDFIYGGDGNDSLLGEEGSDALYGQDGNDTLDGGADNDLIYGDGGNDSLLGEEGNDTLYGQDGNDTLDGGAGNDLLDGGPGNDTYLFGRTSGQDTILSQAGTVNNRDVLKLAADVLPTDIDLIRNIDDLILTLRDTGDRVTVAGYFVNDGISPSSLEAIEFNNGTTWDFAAVKAMLLLGTEGNDQILGYNTADVIDGLDGHDVIEGRGGDDLIIGGAGNDTLLGQEGNDTLDGGVGNDSLQGGVGNDTYLFGRGTGQDTVIEYDTTTGNFNKVQIASGVMPADVKITRDQSHLYLSIENQDGTTDRLTLQNWFSGNAYQVEQVVFADDSATVWDAMALTTLVNTPTEGVDILSGTSGDDVINGLGGNDTLYGQAGNDTLDGGAGNDFLQGDTDNDTYLFNLGGGQDTIYDGASSDGNVDTLRFGAGIAASDITFSRGRYDLVLNINGTADQVKVQNWRYDDYYHIERVEFADGRSWDAAYLQAQAAAAPIVGTTGNDYLPGDGSNDTLDGGAGNDTLLGNTGNDTYLFNLGGGQDMIYDVGGAADTLHFGVGIAVRDIIFTRNDNDLLLSINGTMDQVRIRNWSYGDYYHIEQVEFADGTVWNAAYLQTQAAAASVYTIGNDSLFGSSRNDTLDGGPGNDTLQGGTGNDIYLFNLGGGQDTISDSDNTAGNVDAVRFGAGIVSGDIILTRNDNDLLLSINGTMDQVRIRNWSYGDYYHIEQVEFADGTVWGEEYLQTKFSVLPIVGTTGNDTLVGNTGNNTLDGRAGNDTLQGGTGNDIYLFNLGGGQDTISDYDYTAGNADTVRFGAGIASGDIAISRSGNDLMLSINSTSDQLKIQNWGSGDAYHIERVEFADGTIWDTAYLQTRILSASPVGTEANDYLQSWLGENASLQGMGGNDTLTGNNGNDTLDGGAGNDTLTGNNGNDTLDGGTGNDTLQGGSGNDTYLFNLGGGQDIISDVDSTAGNVDTVRFGVGIAANDIIFSRNGDNLVLSIDGTTDQLKIQNWGYGDYCHIERVEFADGTVWDAAYLQTRISALPVVGTNGYDDLHSWSEANEILQGMGGNDNLGGGSGNNTLEGGIGNDYLQGGMGNDTYLFNLGDGQDTIYDSSGNQDAIQFGAGIAVSDITFSRSGNDLVLSINGTSDQLKIQNWWAGNDYRTERVEFADGTVWNAALIQARIPLPPIVGTDGNDFLYALLGENAMLQGLGGDDYLFGNNGNDILEGGVGNDYLRGGLGNDVYVFGLGDGQDSFYDGDSTAGNVDTIRFGAGIVADDITFSHPHSGYGGDLMLSINGTTDQVTLQNWSYGDAYHIERVEFADGTLWDTAHLQAQISAIPVVGTVGNDYLFGDAGNNTLDGGAGNDILQGGTGNDTYLFNLGDGQDMISDGDSTAGNVDTVRFGAGITAGDITFSRSGDDLVLSINGTSDQLKIQDWRNGSAYRIERVEFADGTVWNAAQLQAFVPAILISGTEQTDYLYALMGENSRLQGLGGNDILYGNDGNDILDGGTGNDGLTGRWGNDVYVFGLGGGQDFSYDGDSTVGNVDTLRFGAGIVADDITFSRSGNDLVLGIEGTMDQWTIYNWSTDAASRIERVEFADGTVWDAAQLQSFVPATFISGTEADDFLQGGIGNDTYLFNPGGGQDTISDSDSIAGNVDTIRFGAGIVAGDIIFSRSGNDLVLSINGTPDQLKIQNWRAGDSYYIERVEFAGGASWDTAQLQAFASAAPISGTDQADSLQAWASENTTLQGLGGDDSLYGNDGNDILDGGVGNDYLSGGTGNDTYRFNVGDGQDTVMDEQGSDTLYIGGNLTAADLEGVRDGDNMIVNVLGTADSITLINWFVQNQGVNRINFGDGYSLDHLGIEGLLNRPPMANPDAITVFEDDGVMNVPIAALLANDTDSNANDVISVVAVGASAIGASVLLVPSIDSGQGAQVQYDIGKRYQELGAEQAVTDSFDYTISDSKGATSDSVVNVTITGVNDAPITVADTVAVQEDFIVSTTGNVLGNDTDVDQDAVLSVANAGEFTGSYGRLTLAADGGYSYALDNTLLALQSLAVGQTGTETFDYQATDGLIAIPSTLSFTITGTNDAPVTTADIATVQKDHNIAATGNVLSNDIDVDQGDVLSAANAGVFIGNYGSLTLTTDGSYIYALNNAASAVKSLVTGQAVTETFGYQTTDGLVSTPSTLTVTITGNSSNNAPVVIIPLLDQTAAESGTFSYQLPVNTFTDIDTGDRLSYGAKLTNGNPLPDWLTFNADTRTFNSTLPNGSGGLWDINVTATDTSGVSATSAFGLDVADLIKGTGKEDALNGTVLRDLMYGLADNDWLRGAAAADVLVGGSGNDVLEGHSGDDILIGGIPVVATLAGAPVPVELGKHKEDSHHNNERDKSGNNLLNGGTGNDSLIGGSKNDLLIGGIGNDAIDTGTGANIIAFNRGDGQDSVLSSTGNNTLSLGSSIKISDLHLRHLGNDLILETGLLGQAQDRITFCDWYASPKNRSIDTLQMIGNTETTASKAHIDQYDFSRLVKNFDKAVAANASTDHWALTNAKLDKYLEVSKGEALGGDLSYRYGKDGSLATVSLNAAQDVMNSASFGINPQDLHNLFGLTDGLG
ncbi:MAG: calcium-binding protein [Methylococcaceae bacterium]